MKILIYLGHPAQFHFFKNIISKLLSDGHQVKLLIKTKDVLENLVNLNGLEYSNIQEKPRKNNYFSILFASLIRTSRVYKIAKEFNADLLIGGDASIAQTGFLLKKRAITVLEDDIDVIANLAKLTFPFTSNIVTPTVCNVGRWDYKKIGYFGYMKLAYLHPNRFTPDREIVRKYIQTDKYCIIRLAQLTAHHDVGIKGLNIGLVKEVIEIAEQKGYTVYISSEAELDISLSSYQLKFNQNDIHHLMAFASLLISDSQSMSVEAAMLGVPSVRFSDFSGRISVLEELEHTYQLTFGVPTNQPEKLINLVVELLSNEAFETIFKERRLRMLNDKIDVTAFMVWLVENYPESAKIIKENPDFQNRFKGVKNQVISQIKDKSIVDTASSYNDTEVKFNSDNDLQPHSTFGKKTKINSSNFRDFTPTAYRYLLLALIQANFAFFTFEDWCKGKAHGRFVILRHDVDLKADLSLATAKIENELGIRASYFFRVVPQSNQPKIIKAIATLGHEIGYHYEEMSIFNGDVEKSIAHFKIQLDYFRQFYPVKTISMHGSPTSKWDNRDLWKTYNYRDYGIIGEPYFDFLIKSSKKSPKVMYFTDTGRMWDGAKYNVRDKFTANHFQLSMDSEEDFDDKEVKTPDSQFDMLSIPNIHSTHDFIDWLKSSPNQTIMMITTHPQR